MNLTLPQIYQDGTRVARVFGDQIYEGRVKYYKLPYYCIEYCNQDMQDMTAKEVGRHLHDKSIRQYQKWKDLQIKRFKQMTMDGHNLEHEDAESFGNIYPSTVQPEHMIITFQNISPQTQYGNTDKAKITNNALKESSARVAMYAEISLNKYKLQPQEKFAARLKSVNKQFYVAHTFNKHLGNTATWEASGGTVVAIDEMMRAHKAPAMGQGSDEEGLGQWTWIWTRGKNDQCTRSISAYRP